ncbi:nucleoside diphosphate kinase [Salix suchowensis]|nr:nucleoside diphosphate kinase [Salix suchowensis]
MGSMPINSAGGKQLFFSSPQPSAKMSTSERTYIMIKRNLVGKIIARFEEHYADLKGKPFFPGLIKYMASGPVVCMVWQGLDAVKTGRVMLGATNPGISHRCGRSIRGDFCLAVGRNICHGSDSVESAEKEIALWFPDGVVQWTSALEGWVFE